MDCDGPHLLGSQLAFWVWAHLAPMTTSRVSFGYPRASLSVVALSSVKWTFLGWVGPFLSFGLVGWFVGERKDKML